MYHFKKTIFLMIFSISAFSKTPLGPKKSAVAKPNEQIIELSITDLGYQPSIVNADPDKLIVLKVTRKTKALCVKSLKVSGQHIHRKLPLNKPVLIRLGKVEPGEIKLGCLPELKESGLIYVK